MKTIFDFVYCQGDFSPLVVWYQVRVGISKRDQSARRFIECLSRCSGDMLFCKHSPVMVSLKDSFARQLADARPAANRYSTLLLRQITIEVRSLASFLRKCPAALLNSPSLPDVSCLAHALLAGITSEAKDCSRRAKHGLKSSRQSLHVKNLSKHGNKSQS